MRFLPGSSAAARGMVPDAELSAEPFTDDSALTAARVAALAGDWHPAAKLIAETAGDWDRRTAVVVALAKLAMEERAWLRAWLADRPGNPDAAVMEAETLVGLAWQRRGGARAAHTSRQQSGPFFKLLEHAGPAAWRAAELAEADPTPWATLLKIATGLGARNQSFDGIWSGLTVRAPHHRIGHDRALQYWCAKWHGSEERMLEFAVGAAAKAPALSPLPLIAAFEMALEGAPTWRAEYVQKAFDQALPWLDGDGARHPATHEDRAYTILALMHNSRYDEAVAQFRRLGGHADGHVWNFTEDIRGMADPVKRFARTRTLACRRAAKQA